PSLALPSFPTRRSSDLVRSRAPGWCEISHPVGLRDGDRIGDAPRDGSQSWATSTYRSCPMHLPINHHLRPVYRTLAGLTGVWLLDRKSTRLNSSHVKIS